MNIFISGAEGFIGSHLTEKLLKLGHNVTALVLYNSFNSCGWLQSIKKKHKLKIIYGDLKDVFFLESKIKNFDVVFHLGALVSIPYSYLSFNSFIDNNISGTTNLLTACLKGKVKKVFVTSTSEVYGTAQYVPIDEKHPLNAQSPYAATKVAADQISLSFYRSFNLPVTIIRPFNTFGPRQSNRAIIPTLITQMLHNKKFIRVGNIKTIRDFTYIEDTVNGFISAMKSKNIIGEVINISSGFEISISDLIVVIKKELKIKKLNIIVDKKRLRPEKSEVNRLFGSNKKAKIKINWKPKYSKKKGFVKALNKTIEWFKEEKNLKDYNSEIYNI